MELQFTLKVPVDQFSTNFIDPLIISQDCPVDWMDAFKNLEKPNKAKNGNVKLVSQDGGAFYYDKSILEKQSNVFAAMFDFPAAPNAKVGEYEFPNMSGTALKAFLAYFYGQRPYLDMVTADDPIAIADAAEQHGKKDLKRACSSFLGSKYLSIKQAVELYRFADLHGDWKYLKYRAMTVLSKGKIDFEQLKEMLNHEDGRGDRLFAELETYYDQRLVVVWTDKEN